MLTSAWAFEVLSRPFSPRPSLSLSAVEVYGDNKTDLTANCGMQWWKRRVLIAVLMSTHSLMLASAYPNKDDSVAFSLHDVFIIIFHLIAPRPPGVSVAELVFQ